MQETRTRSPGSRVVTAAPISTTVPTASWPSTVPGSTSGTSPFRMWRSVPQIVDESTRTTTSPGSRTAGSGTVSQTRRPGPWYTHALGELDEPGRVALFVVVPGDDLHLRAV